MAGRQGFTGAWQFLIGGGTPVEVIEFKENYTYVSPTSSVIDVSRCFSTREARKSSLQLGRLEGSWQLQPEPLEQDRLMLVGAAHAATAEVDSFRGGKDDVHHS